ncbi:MAG: acetamidase/formamidase family protein [Saprospiraceae bacterium]|nr:acetamidase/formamidase family protein [Saprospiraceae bacterium]
MKKQYLFTALKGLCLLLVVAACNTPTDSDPAQEEETEVVEETSPTIPEVQYTLTKDQTHSKFSSAIEPVLRVPSGSVIEAFTEDASDEQFKLDSDASALEQLSFDPIHPITGPVYVEGAEVGDVLKVKLHKIDVVDWGWTAILPGFGFLPEDFKEPYLRTFPMNEGTKSVPFTDKVNVPLRPFPGVMGVAPATEEMLSTIPPRANGGNMDDPHMIEGTTVYFPVFVEGGLFSIGDGHAVQGMGEVCGTGLEAPMRIVYEIEVLKGGRAIDEPEYETDDYYAVTAFGTSIDEAAKKAVRYMVKYLQTEHGLTASEAYALCSLAGDLQIAEVVDVPHMLVAMHMSKEILGIK